MRQEMASSGTSGGLDWILRKISSPEALSNKGTGCPGKWLNHPWRYLKNRWMWRLGMGFIGALGRVGLMIGLDNLKSLFQHK